MANFWDNDLPVSPFDAAMELEGFNGLKADIARSIFQQESSSGKNTATSNAGAVGGMQIIPATFKRMADEGWDINNPVHNARAGLRYISKLHDLAEGDPALTAVGYYGGEGAIPKAKQGIAISDPRNPNAPSTLEYAKQVVSRIGKGADNIASHVFPAANAGTEWWANDEPVDPKELQGANIVTDSAPGITVKYSDDSTKNPLTKSQDNSPQVSSVSSSPFVGGLMGLGYGVGQVGLGAQHWVGKGAKAVGFDKAGDWLIDDAKQGRDRLDLEIQPYKEVSPFSTGTGALAGNIAATWPVGGLIGKGVGATVPMLSKFAPSVSPYVQQLANAISSGGMKLGGAPATGLLESAANMGLRSLGGAINGAATAGLVDPEDWMSGAVIGAAAPPVIAGAASLGHKVGDKLGSNLSTQLANYTRKEPLNNTIRQSVDAGYVIPPNMVNPSFKNQVIESISGKQATQQIASTKNNEVTGSLIRKALGIADDAPLNVSSLENIRKDAGKAYSNIANLSEAASKDLELLKQARNDSQAWFKAYNRSASPNDLSKAKEFRTLASELESKLEKYATDAGRKELIPALRDSRQLIAKTYTVERALKDASGNVDARVLARLYEKGAPLTEELLTVGKFGSAFPSIAKSPEQIGSPAAHNIKALASALMGAGGAAATGPLGVAAAAVPFVTPPMARALMFRNGAQQALIPNAPTAGYAQRLAELLQKPDAQMLIGKSAPIFSTLLGQQGAQ